ncbi:hypothetical protein BGW80DRAFT_1500858 [Lactifluus volemus]|nr:hypothetical protein BGW80DRAFT_1500858 [Lactifluus volemus]
MSEFTTDETADTLTAVGDFTHRRCPRQNPGHPPDRLALYRDPRGWDMVSTDDEIQDRANALKINHVADRPSVLIFGSTFSPPRESQPPMAMRLPASPAEATAPGTQLPSSASPRSSPRSRRSPSAGEIRDQSPQLLWQDFTLRIIGEPKLRDFLNSLRDRHMLPFYFHKKKVSYNGCRHFAWAILFTSEAVEAWKRHEYIMDRCIGTRSFYRDLIGVRSRVFLPIRSPARKETAAMRLAACGRRRTRSTGASSLPPGTPSWEWRLQQS